MVKFVGGLTALGEHNLTNFLFEGTILMGHVFTIVKKVNGVSPECFDKLSITFSCLQNFKEGFGIVEDLPYFLQSPAKEVGFLYDCTQFASGKTYLLVGLIGKIVGMVALNIPGFVSFLHQHRIIHSELAIYSDVAQSIGNFSIYGKQPFHLLTQITVDQATTLSLICVVLCSAYDTYKRNQEKIQKFSQIKNEESEELFKKSRYEICISVWSAVIWIFKLFSSPYEPYIAIPKHVVSLWNII